MCKTLPWGAGPVALQQLALLSGFDLAELSPAELVHVVTECAKLAFADRDALYGDGEVPLETLLSPEYNDERRALVGEDASADYVPGLGRLPSVVGAPVVPGRRRAHARRHGSSGRRGPVGQHALGDAERRLAAQLAGHPLVGLAARDARADVLARGGAARRRFAPVRARARRSRPGSRSATASPTSRGARPAATSRSSGRCTPSSATSTCGLDLQAAIDAPEFHTDHLISSFYPRGFAERSLTVESRFGDEVVDDLRRRGHDVDGRAARGRSAASPPSRASPTGC